MSNFALAYFAGLVDGEGCICIKRIAPPTALSTERSNSWGRRRSPTYVYSLTIAMSDPRPVRAFCKHFGLAPTYSWSRLRVKPHHRPIFVAHVGGPRGVAVLKQLLPYLICKRAEALIAIRFYEEAVAGFKRHGFGFNRKPVPARVLARRHRLYLSLQALKRRSFSRDNGLRDAVENTKLAPVLYAMRSHPK